MHTSCRSLDGATGRSRSNVVADALLSQWGRRSGTASTWPSHSLSVIEDGPASSLIAEAAVCASSDATDAGRHAVDTAADGRAPPLQPVPNVSAAPPSIEELLAEVDENHTDTSATASSLTEEKEREVLKCNHRHGADLLPPADSFTFVAYTSPEGTGLKGTSDAACSPASSTAEAALLEALLQEKLSEELSGDANGMLDEGLDELEEEAPRAADGDVITNSAYTLTQGEHHSPEVWRVAHLEAALDDADSEVDAKRELCDDAAEEEESMESVLEEEAERMYHAALTSMANNNDTPTQGGAKRGTFSDCTFFSKEAVDSVAEYLSIRNSAAATVATSTFSPSEGSRTRGSMLAVEFDDNAVLEAEMESVGDVMATSGSGAAVAVKGEKVQQRDRQPER
ncbi:hypothetical protein, conserved [Leishmania lindenbergi]|uniref:Uncharacterized protein n=1 Tax=Leishmania lindenbergi TaxID=651832 RepID=A0AAW3A0G9_9TRYP